MDAINKSPVEQHKPVDTSIEEGWHKYGARSCRIERKSQPTTLYQRCPLVATDKKLQEREAFLHFVEKSERLGVSVLPPTQSSEQYVLPDFKEVSDTVLLEQLEQFHTAAKIFDDLSFSSENPREIVDQLMAYKEELTCFFETMHVRMMNKKLDSSKNAVERLVFDKVCRILCSLANEKSEEIDLGFKLSKVLSNEVQFQNIKRKVSELLIKSYKSHPDTGRFGEDLEILVEGMINFAIDYTKKRSPLCDKKHPGYNEDDLSRITFLHGTNTGFIPGLQETNGVFMPRGTMLNSGIIPLSGEVVRPIGSTINEHNLSCVDLFSSDIAMKYAQGSKYHCPSKEELKSACLQAAESLKESLPDKLGTLYSCARDFSHGWSISKAAVALMRLRHLDQEAWRECCRILTPISEAFSKELEEGSKCEDYRVCILKDGFSDYIYDENHRDYWGGKMRPTVEAIKQLSLAVQQSPAEECQLDISKPMSMVVGSHSLVPKVLISHASPCERMLSRSARLGDDVQFIFCEKKNIQSIQEKMKKIPGMSRIHIRSFERLRFATEKEKEKLPAIMNRIFEKWKLQRKTT